MINAGADAIMRPDGWWCKQPDFLKNWTRVQWISYSHSSDSVSKYFQYKLINLFIAIRKKKLY